MAVDEDVGGVAVGLHRLLPGTMARNLDRRVPIPSRLPNLDPATNTLSRAEKMPIKERVAGVADAEAGAPEEEVAGVEAGQVPVKNQRLLWPTVGPQLLHPCRLFLLNTARKKKRNPTRRKRNLDVDAVVGAAEARAEDAVRQPLLLVPPKLLELAVELDVDGLRA